LASASLSDSVPGVTPGKRLALRGMIFAAALGATSAAYQQIGEARDRRRFPPPGRLIDIGGRRLHLFEAGVGPPTVVIIPAVGDGVLLWLSVLRELATETRVCVYERSGIGWSDSRRHGRRTVDGMADDLHTLLDAAEIKPPYVLAGHSFGGIVARRFTARRSDGVCGLLLIDSSHEDQARRLREEGWREGSLSNVQRALRRQARVLGARRLAAALGLLRHLDTEAEREAPADFVAASRADILSTRRRRVVVRELLILARPLGQPPDLGALPLTVITSAEPDHRWRARPAWVRLQAELAALSSDSRHVYASRAGHYVHLDEPELVVQAVRDLVNRCH